MRLIFDAKFNLRPPSVNHYTKNNRSGGKRRSGKTKEFYSQYEWLLIQRRPKKSLKQLKVKITINFKDKRKRDVDNYTKCIFDGMSGKVFEDDSQIKGFYVEKNIGCEKDSFEVKIWEI